MPENNQIQKKDKESRASLEISSQMSFSSPLPPPQLLKQYNEIIPDFAQKLNDEVYNESNHRRSCERWIVRGGTMKSFVGQVFAFVIALFGLYIAWKLGENGNPVAAGIIATIDLVGLVSVFLTQSYFESKTEPRNDLENE